MTFSDVLVRPARALRLPQFIALCALLVLLTVSTAARAEGPGPLEGRFFGNPNGSVLVVVLHGDLSDGSNADYQYDIARRIAAGSSNVLAFGMIRPGYRDSGGLRSRGFNSNRSDHYTSRNNQMVADTIANLRRTTGVRRVVVLGHSGGAAQVGAIIGRFPGLIDSAVLVACPCDVDRWRRMNGRRAWSRSQSPSDFAARVPGSTRVIAVTGNADDNTWPSLASDYIAALRARGLAAEFVAVGGAGHSYRGALATTAERLVLREVRR